MSYNTRRSNTSYGSPHPQQVGQRRAPAVSNNFISGGQLSNVTQPQQQQQQQQKLPSVLQQRPNQQQMSGINYRNQAQQGQQQNTQYPPPQRQVPQVQTPEPVKKSEPVKQIPQQVKPVPAVVSAINPPPPEPLKETMEEEKKKVFPKWKSSKISKAERLRRRNLRLSKILQPKNAVMILNELVKGCVYNVEEVPIKVDANQYRGTVSFEGQEFAGTGRSKSSAKNAAAEAALKYLIKYKKLMVEKKDDAEEKMEVDNEDGAQSVPWSHIASFAMYKLFSTWGEDLNFVNKLSLSELVAGSSTEKKSTAGPREQGPNPAKKMPNNPETMNPMMLVHQMLPNAIWDEVGKSGNPPNIMFTFRVNIDGKEYTGTGSSKKAAKKSAAFAACHEILHVNYPPDIWSPIY